MSFDKHTQDYIDLLFEQWVNGNRTYVKNHLDEMPTLKAASFAAAIAIQLNGDEARDFVHYLYKGYADL